MSLEEKIVGVLHQKIGFNPASVGSESIIAAVRASLGQRKIANPEAYLEGLRNGNKDFEEIINAVTIPETWFFRDDAPFDVLKSYVSSEWKPKNAGRIFRCLSLPSSTGEEPYSIAMSLFDCGLSPAGFSIDGVDINTKSLLRAKTAVYGPYSFRAKDISFRERFFDPVEGGWRLRDMVRDSVAFSQGNMLDPAFMNDGRQYDVIFCRNLLIYFDAAGWTAAVKTLDRLLSPVGLLFMGHAEALDLAAPEFESLRIPCSFAYRKKRPAPPTRPASSAMTSGVRPAESTRPKSNGPGMWLWQSKPEAPASPTPKPGINLLEKAGELADQGKLVEAALACERYLLDKPASVQAYFLLGLIRMGEGKSTDAENFFSRALYLDSKHYQALVHLALLREGRGDRDGAMSLRRRADALKAK